MPETSISVFISYARKDTAFVDRLEADLQARNFRTWVDRRKLEGGQEWLDKIQKAIEQCQVLLIVLSPEAAGSNYVRMEYRHAQRKSKPMISLDYRPCPEVPMDLNHIQWIDFTKPYEEGLKELLVALSRLEMVASETPKHLPLPTLAQSMLANEIKEPDLVEPQPAPPLPEPELDDLYRGGAKARSEGDLERTAVLWAGKILDRDPNFQNGTFAPLRERLMQELHPLRVKRLRERAEQASSEGEWGQEIGAWEALLGLEPQDEQAQRRIPLAKENQKYAWHYEYAQQFVEEGDLISAKTELEIPANMRQYLLW